MIYVILDKQDRIPVLTATSIDKIKELLDEYMGLGKDNNVEYIGFVPRYDMTEYFDIYEGSYVYKYNEEQQCFIRYCMNIDILT